MKKQRINKTRLILLLFLLSLLPFNLLPSASALVWGTGVVYNCDNEYYRATTPLTVDNISISTHWFNVNGIGFNTTAPNPVYINFSSIKSYPKSATGYIMNFTETHTAGATQYIINGLKPSYAYNIITNGSDYPQTSSASGTLYLNQTGSSRNHKLYDPGIPAGWYVSLPTNTPAGSDSNPGTLAAPFATLRKAINASTTSDTIYIRGGNYQEPGWNRNTLPDRTGTIIINRSGTYTHPFTISNYMGEKVVIDGAGESIASGYGMIRLYSGTTCWSNITFYGINFSNCSADCVYGAGFAGGTSNNNITISNCDFFHIFKRALYFNNPNYPSVWMNYININNCTFKYIQDNSTTGECVSFIGTRYYTFENSSAKEFVKQFINAGGSYGNIRFNSFENEYYFTIKFDPSDNGDYSAHDINIYNNVFYGTAVAGTLVAIYLNPENTGGAHHIYNINIYNNIFNLSCSAAKVSHGIAIYPLHSGDWIYNIYIKHNTFYCGGGTGSECIRIRENSKKLSSIYFANNIFSNGGTATNQVYFYDFVKAQTNVTLSHNSYYKYGGATTGVYYTDDSSDFGGATNKTVDPQLHSRITGDFELNVTSPMIDTGTATYGVTTDYSGNTRPQFSGYDIGAYEYSIGGAPPSPSFLFSSESPTNNTIGLAFTPTVSIHIHEIHGYKFNYTIRENHTVPGVWTLLDSANNQGNGTYTHVYHPATDYGTIYGWKITAVNGTTWHNETYYFTTTTPTIPAFLFSSETPTNASIGVALTPTTEVHIHETHGFRFNYSMITNATGPWIQYLSGTYAVNSTVGFIDLSASSYSTKYWWKVIAWNGTTYHNETYHFTTMAIPPPSNNITVRNIHANWTTSTSINITWVKGADCTNTEVYRSTTGYMIGAVLRTSGTNSYFNDTSLNPTTRYYYTLKPYNSGSLVYGPTHNVSLAETDNTSITTSSSALFKGWLTTDKNMKANYHYSSSQDFGTTTLNITSLSDYYNGTAPYSHEDSYYGLYLFGQTFRTGTDRIYLYNISIHGYRSGTPLTTLNMRLYDANATGKPAGAILATGTKDITGVTTSATGEWITTEMPSYYLKSRTTYAFICYIPGGSGSLLVLHGDNTAPMYSEGCLTESGDGGATYTNTTTEDALFRINSKTPMTYPAGGLITTNSTITTTSLYDILKNNLVAGWMYYYYATANDTKSNTTRGNMRYTLTNPDAPVFLNILPSFTNNSVKITWIPGGGANRTIIRESNVAYPSLVTDGTLSYNDTGSICWVHNISFNMTYYFSLFSFTTWGSLSRFSSGVHIPWGGVTFIVYNESKPWQVINASVLVTDHLGLHPVQFLNIYGYYSFNISQIPYGENTIFYVSNVSYESRQYPITIIPNIFYNFSFYLPPLHPPGWNTTTGNASAYYKIQIKDQKDLPVQNALVKIHRYLNTTANYTYIGGFVTDGNGEGSIALFPNILYMIKINCTGYIDETNSWAPTIIDQGTTKIFKIYTVTEAPETREYTEEITFNGYIDRNTLVIHVNYTDALSLTINAQIIIYELDFHTNVSSVFGMNLTVGDSDVYVSFPGADNRNTYTVVLQHNHSVFGYHRQSFIIGPHITKITTPGYTERLFNYNYGFNPFGWTNCAMFGILLLILFNGGREELPLDYIALGVIFLFLNMVIGFFTWSLHAGDFIPIMCIIAGVLTGWHRYRG